MEAATKFQSHILLSLQRNNHSFASLIQYRNLIEDNRTYSCYPDLRATFGLGLHMFRGIVDISKLFLLCVVTLQSLDVVPFFGAAVPST